jgi:hypothetical protein
MASGRVATASSAMGMTPSSARAVTPRDRVRANERPRARTFFMGKCSFPYFFLKVLSLE